MDLFTLSAVLGLDTSSFTSGLGIAQAGLKALKTAVSVTFDFVKDSVETGMGFDRQMSAVQAVLGQEEGTVENMTKLRAFALEQARDSIFTAEETAKAYYYMGMAGWKSEQMQKGLPGIMALAAASGEDLAKVSDIVTDSITAFGLTAGDVTRYVDLLAQTATNSNTDVKRMGETFKYIAPIAGSLGADVEDVALAIGLLADTGIKGSMAGTALRNILTRLSTNAGATQKDLGALEILTEKLGVAFWDSAGKMRDFSDIIMDARKSWRGLTQEQQVYYSKQIGSQRGMAAWLALMNATDEEVQKLQHSLEVAGGAAQTMADVKLDNLWGDIEMFKASLDVLKIALYDDVKSPLRDVVQYGTGALDRITDALNEDGLIGGIRQLGVEIKQFGVEYQDEITELFRAIAPILEAVISELGPPVIDALTKLGAGAGGGLVQGITDVVTNPSEATKNLIPNLINIWWEGFKGTTAAQIDWGKQMAGNIANGFRGGVGQFIGNIQFGIDQLVYPIWDKITAARKWGRDMIQNFINGITQKWNDLKNSVANVAATVRSYIGFSEPELGPLSDFHTYAPDMMRLFAQGIKDNEYVVTDQINRSFDFGNNAAQSNAVGEEIVVPRNSAPREMTVVLQLNDYELGRALVPLVEAEQQRVGVKLVRGGVY